MIYHSIHAIDIKHYLAQSYCKEKRENMVRAGEHFLQFYILLTIFSEQGLPETWGTHLMKDILGKIVLDEILGNCTNFTDLI